MANLRSIVASEDARRSSLPPAVSAPAPVAAAAEPAAMPSSLTNVVAAEDARRSGAMQPPGASVPTIAPSGQPSTQAGMDSGGSMSIGETLATAGSNLGPSALRFGKDLVEPFLSPVQTSKAVGNLILGGAQKLIPGEQDEEKYADAVGTYFADRYGGLENIQNTFATDPVGFLADASTLLTGGAALAGKVPMLAGRVAKTAATAGATGAGATNARSFANILKAAGDLTDPVRLAARGLPVVGRVGSEGLGLLTGTSGEAVRTAARSGALGGYLGERFRSSMRGKVPLEEVVDEAKAAVNVMRHERSDVYRKGMADVGKDQTVLTFDGIDKSMARMEQVKTYKGKSISKSTEGIREKLRAAVDEWKGFDPTEYHTAEGLDALKQSVGDILESTPFHSPERKAASEVYQAIRSTIVDQAPDYGKIMRSYERAQNQIKEIEQSLSLGKKANAETALRKLQSIMRNDVTSAYGKRADLAKKLEAAGAKGLTEAMGGQAMSSALPRGIARMGAGMASVGVMGGPPGMLAALPLTSPRLVGEAVHGAARAIAPVVGKVPSGAGLAAFQGGRAAGVMDDEDQRLSDLALLERR